MGTELKARETLLVVDDKPTNLEVLSDFLTDAGFDVLVASDGESAITQVAYQQPDLILLDIMMPPGIDGFETCARLKADQATQQIPVVFMSALSETVDKVRGLSLGAIDYITKPFQQEEVLARVRTHLKLQSLVKALEEKNELLEEFTENLEQKVVERTVKLQQAQVQLVQQEKLSMLGQLIAGVAHEINNPVGFIVGNINPAQESVADLVHILDLYRKYHPHPEPEIQDVIQDVDLDFVLQDLPQILDSMKIGADRILNLSLSLRNFARSDSSTRMAVDLHDGLDSTLLILQHRLKDQGDRPAINVIKQYGDLPSVNCYPNSINQVFMNLLSNAIDALEETSSSLSSVSPNSVSSSSADTPQIQIQTDCPSPEHVTIQIIDNGLGISTEIQKRIFEPMFTTKPLNKGTGLGLSISRQIVVDKHGGNLFCESQPGHGTTFRIELPVGTPTQE